MKFVRDPNLPIDSKIVLIGEKYSDILVEKLNNLGLKTLFVPDNPNVDKRVSGHVDLSVLHLGKEKIALAEYLKGSGFAIKLRELGMDIVFSDFKQSKTYPSDSALNICICGKNLIYNPKTAENIIVDYLTSWAGFNKLKVKQGYTKCSVCVVDENAIITADETIHRAAGEADIDSLKISPGFIDLDGFEYGFIGGASFKINKSTLAFTGHLDKHPDRDKIIEFACLHNVDIVYITDNPAFDIGSVIQIVEK